MKFSWKNLLISSVAIILGTFVILFFWLLQLRSQTQSQLVEKSFLKPTEYYSTPLKLQKNSRKDLAFWRNELLVRGYRERSSDQTLLQGDFQGPSQELCSQYQVPANSETRSCLRWKPSKKYQAYKNNSTEGPFAVSFDQGQLDFIWDESTNTEIETTALDPILFAQMIADQPIRQTYKTLGEIPPSCLNSVLAIEDSQFLTHSGFSLTSILRAIYNNTFGRGIKQGASTITQQLVKNQFLTPEKTLRRKAREFFLAVVLETIATKDLILETYLNIIYLGQAGPFQIRGFPAASQFYFQKEIESLEIHECALLAAVLNSPGLYDPFKKPQNALKRRNLVLDRMLSLGFITDEEAQAAKNTQLPPNAPLQAAETAPYFIQAVNKELKEKEIYFAGGAVFTTMDLYQQTAAQQAVNEGVEKILQTHPKLKEQPEALQSLFLSVDVKTSGVTSLVGGRSYRASQFNRAIQGHRQIGSLMKPFVFLSAFLNSDEITPTTEILDEKQIYEYEGQKWAPENYDKKFYGAVPMYFALKNSLNAATANLGMQAGLEKIIQTAQSLGVESEMKAFPSLTLGAFELYASEVAQSYLTLARFGRYQKISFVESVLSSEGELVFERELQSEERLSPQKVAMLVGMMRQTLLTGTAKSLQSLNLASEVAGKTGTTSDHKDAWFAGFSPHLLAVAWIGFDDNTPTKLTGSSGPAPIWGQFMKNTESFYSAAAFQWPQNTQKTENPDERQAFDPPDYLIFSN